MVRPFHRGPGGLLSLLFGGFGGVGGTVSTLHTNCHPDSYFMGYVEIPRIPKSPILSSYCYELERCDAVLLDAHQSTPIDHSPADLAQPPAQTLSRDMFAISGYTQQEFLEWSRIEVQPAGPGARAGYLDDSAGRMRRVESKVVGDPEAEELAHVGEFRIFLACSVHTRDRVRLAQPDERAAHHPRPGRIAAEWTADPWSAGSKIGTDNGERGGNISAAVGGGIFEGVPLELAQFGALDQRFEIAYEAATDHVALEGNVIAGREHGGAALAFRHLAAAEYPDLDDGTFGHLTQELAGEVVGDVVERNDCRSAEQHGAEGASRSLLRSSWP